MPKQKTHKGARKRFRITAGGRVRRNNSMRNHILTKKTTKRKRNLRRGAEVTGKFAKQIKEMLHS